ncbi:MAG: hypothetical protein LLG44_02535 [Chloroflexi bacterium]|nr:hypothetical protein [Chloroflexota bacterium]
MSENEDEIERSMLVHRRGSLSRRIVDRLVRRSPAGRILHREAYRQQAGLATQRAVRIISPEMPIYASTQRQAGVVPAANHVLPDADAAADAMRLVSGQTSNEEAQGAEYQESEQLAGAELPEPPRLSFDEMTAILQRNTEALGSSRTTGSQRPAVQPAHEHEVSEPAQPGLPKLPAAVSKTPTAQPIRRIARAARIQEMPAPVLPLQTTATSQTPAGEAHQPAGVEPAHEQMIPSEKPAEHAKTQPANTQRKSTARVAERAAARDLKQDTTALHEPAAKPAGEVKRVSEVRRAVREDRPAALGEPARAAPAAGQVRRKQSLRPAQQSADTTESQVNMSAAALRSLPQVMDEVTPRIPTPVRKPAVPPSEMPAKPIDAVRPHIIQDAAAQVPEEGGAVPIITTELPTPQPQPSGAPIKPAPKPATKRSTQRTRRKVPTARLSREPVKGLVKAETVQEEELAHEEALGTAPVHRVPLEQALGLVSPAVPEVSRPSVQLPAVEAAEMPEGLRKAEPGEETPLVHRKPLERAFVGARSSLTTQDIVERSFAAFTAPDTVKSIPDGGELGPSEEIPAVEVRLVRRKASRPNGIAQQAGHQPSEGVLRRAETDQAATAPQENESAAAAEGGSQASAQVPASAAAGQVDLDQLAEEIYRRICEMMRIEQERTGITGGMMW